MSQILPLRSEVPESLTWNLKDLFSDEAAFEAGLAKVSEQTDELVAGFAGKIASLQEAADIMRLIHAYEKLLISIDRIGNYAYLSFSVDMTDDLRVSRLQKTEALIAQIASQISFVDSDLMDVNPDVMKTAAESEPAYQVFFEGIERRRRHRLHPETEKVLAALSPALELPHTVYEQAKHADMAFPDFQAGGKTWPLSFVSFENDYNLDASAEIRREAFKAFSATLRHYQNTVAALYNGEVQKQKIMAGLRGFDSVFDYLLDDQKVDRSLFDRQIDLILQELAPHMRRYARLLAKTHGLDRMTFADLKIALDAGYDPKVTVEESKRYISSGLRVLGQDYHDLVMQAYDQRWVDFASNKGKSTGGFCSSPYQLHGYILLSWTGRLSEVFTLAHELGHAAHFALNQQHQPYLATEPSLYLVEAPSTCNEMLLSQDLLSQNDDPRFQRWVLASMIQNTYFHNFVTHLLEAAYQREVYQLADQGEFLTATVLNKIKRDVLEKFWGDSVEITEGAELTWMRQPHYYMGLYSYTYSAGLTIATAASQRIRREGEPAVEDWLTALKAGGSVSPVEFARLAGIDINTDQPLRDTIAYIGSIIDQLETLSETLA